MARYVDLARTKVGADNLGSIGEIKVLTHELPKLPGVAMAGTGV